MCTCATAQLQSGLYCFQSPFMDLLSSYHRYIINNIIPSQQNAFSRQKPNLAHENSTFTLGKEEHEKAVQKCVSKSRLFLIYESKSLAKYIEQKTSNLTEL